jgi:hypothetical protein
MKLDLETSGWPPQKGKMIYFDTGSGVQKGRFAEIHRGLVWIEYWLDDGRVIAEHDLVMCPRSTPWRDPASVSESERQESCNRIKTVLASGEDLRKNLQVWEEFVQYLAWTTLRMLKEQVGDDFDPDHSLKRMFSRAIGDA